MRYGLPLAGVVAVVTLSGVWATSLQGCDEAYYAQMARGMLETGDLVVPRYDGVPPLDKPPLLLWLVASSFRAFGVGDLQARLPVLALGAALPFVLHQALPGPPEYRFTAAATLATTLLYVQLQHMVMTDLVAFAGLVAFAVALLRAGEGPRWGWWAGLGLGLAALAKGALAALFALAALPYAAAYRTAVLRAGFLLRCVPGLAPAAAWYAVMLQRFGGHFLEVHFGFFLVRLATEGIFPRHPLGPFFYVASALWRFLPWWPLLVAAAWWAYRHRREQPAPSWALSFSSLYFLAITAMQTKHDHYALPLALPVALLLAGWTCQTGPATGAERASGWAYAALGVVFLAGGAAVLGGAAPVEGVPRWPAGALAAGLGAAVLRGAVLLWRADRRGTWRLVLWAAVLAYAVGGVALRPWDAEPGLRALQAHLPRGAEVHYVAHRPPTTDFCPYGALRFRLDRPPRYVRADEFASQGPGWYVGKEGALQPQPADRVVFRGSGWLLVHRP